MKILCLTVLEELIRNGHVDRYNCMLLLAQSLETK